MALVTTKWVIFLNNKYQTQNKLHYLFSEIPYSKKMFELLAEFIDYYVQHPCSHRNERENTNSK